MFLKFNRFKLVLISTFLLITTSVFSSEKNITYMQILQKPNDLDLNLKYAQQQGKMGNYKQTISTLERLTMIYPENVEIKLYLLSVLVQVDSPEKANTIIEEMKLRTDLSPEDLETLKEIEEEMSDREPSLWNISADIGFGLNFTDNINSVSKSRFKMDSDSKAPRIFARLLIPAAVSMCPTFDLTEPVSGSCSPKKSEMDCASIRSPSGVPVA